MDPTLRDLSDSAKLEGQENYLLWSYRVKMLLMQENLWRFIAPASTSNPDGGSSSSADSESVTTSVAGPSAAAQTVTSSPNDDAERKIRACRIIISTVKDHIILHVLHLTDPLAIWTKLRTMYDIQSPSRRLALKAKLHSLRMHEGKTLDSHLQDTNSIVTQLASLGVSIQDEDLVDQMLASLPKSWNTFKAIQKSRDRSPTFSELQGLMLHEESSRILDKQQESEEILYLKSSDRFSRPPPLRDHRGGRFNRGRGRGRFQPARQCRRCGHTDHTEADCDVTKLERQIRDLQIQLSRLKANPSSSYTAVDVPEDDFEEDDTQAALNACMTAFSTDEEPWFLDSGASSHVTGSSDFLSEVSPSSITSIRTAAGQILPVAHKGTVKFKDCEVKSVHDILYVPGVKTNLLSVGRFADLGHTIVFNSTSCLIYDIDYPSNIFLQAHRDHRTKLYRLTATPMVSTEPALLTTHTPKVSMETLELWHRRLAHVHYQGLYHLTNKGLVTGVPNLPYLKRPCTSCAQAVHSVNRTANPFLSCVRHSPPSRYS